MSEREPLRGLLVDFGGVLYDTPQPRWLPLLARLLRIEGGGMLDLLQSSPVDSPVVRDIMTGATREEDVWAEFARRWRIRPERLQRIRSRSADPRRLNTELLAFVSGLRPGVAVALLTNAGSQFRETYADSYRLDDYVDEVIISAEEGLAKPDPALYLLAAERLGISPAEAVMVDDREENILGAREAGMRGIVYTGDTPALIAEIRRMLTSAG